MRKVRAGPVVAASALLGVLGLAVIPAQAYLEQQRHRDELAATVATESAQNRALKERAEVLSTDAEIERLARRNYNLARPGEEVYAILPTAPPPPPPPPAGPPDETERSWWNRVWERVSSAF